MISSYHYGEQMTEKEVEKREEDDQSHDLFHIQRQELKGALRHVVIHRKSAVSTENNII